MKAMLRALKYLTVALAGAVFNACGGTRVIAVSGTVTCQDLVRLARSTGPTLSYANTPEDSAKLARRGVMGAIGLYTRSNIYPRVDDVSDSEVRSGTVLAKVDSEKADKHLRTQGGEHYWAVALTEQDSGISAMVPLDPEKNVECTTLYARVPRRRPNKRAEYVRPPFVAAAIRVALVLQAKAVWEGCGGRCCCTGYALYCEAHFGI